MKDYKIIIKEIHDAVSVIDDQKLKEAVFQRLLEDALTQLPTHSQSKTVEEPEVVTQPKKTSRKKSSSPFNSEAVREEIKTAFDDLDPNQPGVKPFNTLKQKVEKYLWVLVVGKNKGIDIMTNNEVAFVLTEKLSEGATDKQVNNLTFKAKDGIVQKRDIDGVRAWKILQPGIDLVKTE